jgi:hypothetical protein
MPSSGVKNWLLVKISKLKGKFRIHFDGFSLRFLGF